MLMALMKKVDNMQDQMVNLSRETETMRIKSNQNCGNEKHNNREKDALDSFINRLRQMGHESVNWKVAQCKLPRMKHKEKKRVGGKTEHNIQELQDIIKYSNICIIGILEVEERGGHKIHLKK